MFNIINLVFYIGVIVLVAMTFFPPGVPFKERADNEWMRLMLYITLSCIMFYYVLVGFWFSLASLYHSVVYAFTKVLS